MIVYLHGFRSSPRSTKARLLGDALERRGLGDRYRCPQLPVSPKEAAQVLRAVVAEAGSGPLALVGSSLGGYYATWLAETRDAAVDCRVVLINPATRPDRDLVRHLGTQPVYHSDETVDVRPEFLDELVALSAGPITRPERYLLVAATGDEVLDWREMVARYPGARQRIVDGGDHGLSDFPRYIDEVVDFAIGR